MLPPACLEVAIAHLGRPALPACSRFAASIECPLAVRVVKNFGPQIFLVLPSLRWPSVLPARRQCSPFIHPPHPPAKSRVDDDSRQVSHQSAALVAQTRLPPHPPQPRVHQVRTSLRPANHASLRPYNECVSKQRSRRLQLTDDSCPRRPFLFAVAPPCSLSLPAPRLAFSMRLYRYFPINRRVF